MLCYLTSCNNRHILIMERVPWISNSFSPQWMFFFCHIPLWDVGPGCSVLESLQRLFYEKVWLLLAALQTLLTALSFTLTSVTPRRKCGAPDRCWQSFTVALLSESTFFEIKFWNWTDGTVGTNFCADKCYWNRQDFILYSGGDLVVSKDIKYGRLDFGEIFLFSVMMQS